MNIRTLPTALATSLTMLLAAPSALASDPVEAEGPVMIEYVKPTEFTDIKDDPFRTRTEKNTHLIQLRQFLHKEASEYLQKGQKLKISFTDIDLAGDYEPARGPQMNDIRIIRELYPPRLKFDYALMDRSGNIIKEDKVELRDMAFMMRTSIHRSDPLYHEKYMLDKWLRETFEKE
ncbi:DUF3016 domain-containing protein [Permianibacter aggregans]|uniref:DUF3016 family protein n=1 Tax=Permianibacter aggregans TaxID=1510150 RepID=A0A4R6UUF0_9GAMM|nr:DUF3016 domain-containing protein [Permianibacter aggregans]QGX40345.1 DUF3016 domain-containing protein [Permianibacter aggregans]TDQ49529.1 DUF3016 family protein [Permianibacter aggregans]